MKAQLVIIVLIVVIRETNGKGQCYIIYLVLEGATRVLLLHFTCIIDSYSIQHKT